MEFDDENIIINNIDDDGSSSLHQTVIKFIGQIFSLLPPSQSSPYKPFPNRCHDTFRKSSKKENDLIRKSCFVSKMRKLDFTQQNNLLVLEKDFLNFAWSAVPRYFLGFLPSTWKITYNFMKLHFLYFAIIQICKKVVLATIEMIIWQFLKLT